MSGSTPATDSANGRPLFTAEVIFAVLGVLAFVTGVTKRWVLDPLGEAFGDLSPDGKAVVAVLVVVAVAGAIAISRYRRRMSVNAARRAIETHLAR